MQIDDETGERRKHPRVKTRNRISVARLPEDGKMTIHTDANWHYTLDISVGGLCFTSTRRLPLNSQLRIDIIPRDPRNTINLTGIVRWIGKHEDQSSFRIGVELVESDRTRREAWQDHVKRKLKPTD